MKPHPKTGEARLVRQPLKIDKLPKSLRDEIVRLRREENLTWQQIEQRSPSLEGWKDAAPHVIALFPGRRIPTTNLQRWFDLRIEQMESVQASLISQEVAAILKQEFSNLSKSLLAVLQAR